MRAKIFGYARRFLRDGRFTWLLALLGFAEFFLVVVPPDLLLIAGAAAVPRRRLFTVAIVSLGSALGALSLALVVRAGAGALPEPGSGGWATARDWFARYGSWAIFFGAAIPVPTQPFVVAGVLTRVGLAPLFLAVLAGRVVKYSVLGLLPSLLPGRFRPFGGDQQA